MKIRPALARIEPRAARYLELLVEFGHLDNRGVEEIILDASGTYAGTDHPIPLAAVQRHAAAALLSQGAPVQGGEDLLSQDWALLFY